MYTLRDVDIANLDAEQFNVKLRFFVNKKPHAASLNAGSPICASDFYSASYNKVSPCHVLYSSSRTDNLYAASNYYEIEVPFNGTFTETLDGNTISWSATLNDIPNQAFLPRINDQIVCYRKIINKSVTSDNLVFAWDSGSKIKNRNLDLQAPIDYAGTAYAVSASPKFEYAIVAAPCTINVVANPSFETGSPADLNSLYCECERTNDRAYSGSYSLRIITGSTPSGTEYFSQDITPRISASNDVGYLASAYIWQSASNPSIVKLQAWQLWEDGPEGVNESIPVSSSGWNRHVVPMSVLPADLPYIQLVVTSDAPSEADEIYYVDAVQIETLQDLSYYVSLDATPYFDGSYGGGYAWSGSPHVSESTRAVTKWNYGSGSGLSGSKGTIAFWVNVPTYIYGSACGVLWDTGNNSAYILAGANASLFYKNGASSTTAIWQRESISGWQHMVFTWDASVNKRRLYVNGEDCGSSTYSVAGSPTDFALGYFLTASNLQSNFTFDNVLAFNTAIPAWKAEDIFNEDHTHYVDNSWHLWFNGLVTDYSGNVNYAENKRTITVGGIDKYLDKFDTPRITINNLNVASEASVEVSSTLQTPESEIGNREFIGTLVDCSAENIVDTRLDTLWISQDVPVQTVEATPMSPAGGLMIDEFFCNPTPGWDEKDVWWIELLNTGDVNFYLGRDGFALTAYNHNGESVMLDWITKIEDWNVPGPGYDTNEDGINDANENGTRWGNTEWCLPPGERCIICNDQDMFEKYTGGATQADFITEAKIFKPTFDTEYTYGHAANDVPEFDLRSKGGYICLMRPSWCNPGGSTVETTDVVVWGRNMENRDMAANLPSYISVGGGGHWTTACALDGNLADGYSYRRNPTGTDTNSKADWIATQYPKPGDKFAAANFEWAKLELKDLESYLDIDHAADATSVVFDSLLGWPQSGSGTLEGEIIYYTSRTNTTLTLSGSLSNAHLKSARAYPLDPDGVSMTGWLLDSANLQRKPGTSTIKYYQIYTSKYTDRATPADENWELDYEYKTNKLQNGRRVVDSDGNASVQRPVHDINVKLTDINGNPRWTKTILIIIYEMSDGGRAKLNGVSANLSGLAVNNSEFDDIESRKAGNIIKFLLDNYTDYDTNSGFVDEAAAGWGSIGDMQLAINNFSSVVDSLCGNAGCWIRYGVDGQITIERNAWWPGNNNQPDKNLTNAQVRDYIIYGDRANNINGISLNALLPDGTPLSQITVPPSASGTNVVEYNDITVASQTQAYALAWNYYMKEISANKTMSITLKGVGSGFFAGQKITMTINGYDYGMWLVSGVTTNWSQNGYDRTWETNLTLSKYF